MMRASRFNQNFVEIERGRSVVLNKERIPADLNVRLIDRPDRIRNAEPTPMRRARPEWMTSKGRQS